MAKKQNSKSYEIYSQNSLITDIEQLDTCYISTIVSGDIDYIKTNKHLAVDKYWTIRVNYKD